MTSSSPALTGMIVGLIVGVVLVCVGLIIASMRSGASAMYQKPRRIQYFAAWGTPDVILKAIIRFAQLGGYKIDAIDEAGGRIVLSDSASFTSWGFFYPVFLTYQGNGQTVVEVGIKSKLVQYGPIVTRHLEVFQRDQGGDSGRLGFGRGPNSAVPTRTQVDPSSMATSKS